jgi:hypothetical protein
MVPITESGLKSVKVLVSDQDLKEKGAPVLQKILDIPVDSDNSEV